MQAKRELWNYGVGERVWVGKYRNSHNLPHWHDDCELIFAEMGEVDVFCDGKTYALKAGDAMFICGGQVHYMAAKECGVVLTTLVFHYELIKRYFRGLSLVSPVLVGRYPIREAYDRIMAELKGGEQFYGEIAENEIERLMLQIFRREVLLPKAQRSETHEQFKKLLEEINVNFEFFTLTTAAQFMNMNVSYFSRFFHASAGIPFSKYLNYVKVENAVAKLKECKYTVTEIAVECGFGTIRNFNRTFKALTGYAPTEMPLEFQFTADFINKGIHSENPTLSDCELIESSH